MEYLKYSSDEMYSSTELIRKSKMIFDKLNKKSIGKAVILRDGKPSFMLLDFETYEKLMKDYMILKDNSTIIKKEELISLDDIKIEEKIEELDDYIEDDYEEEDEDISDIADEIDEIDDEELQKALEEIDKITIVEDEKTKKEKETPLKEFWD